jgi:hypothetical protein
MAEEVIPETTPARRRGPGRVLLLLAGAVAGLLVWRSAQKKMVEDELWGEATRLAAKDASH